MKNGFIKVAAARPAVCVADCKANLEEMKSIFAKAQKENVRVLVYPELCITGYTCADLFFSDVLLTSAREALIDFAKYTKDTDIVSIISLPLVVNDKIYNSLEKSFDLLLINIQIQIQALNLVIEIFCLFLQAFNV